MESPIGDRKRRVELIMSTQTKPVRKLILSSLVAVTLACGLALGEGTASAQVVTVAPPAVRVEVMGRPPSPAHFWIPGYWNYGPHGHYWVGGRWERNRPGYGWSRAHWGREGRGWRFSPGRWHHR